MEFNLINLDHLPLREQKACMAKQLRDQIARKKKKKKKKKERRKGEKKNNIKEIQACMISQKGIRKFTKLIVCLSGSDTSQSQIQLLSFRTL